MTNPTPPAGAEPSPEAKEPSVLASWLAPYVKHSTWEPIPGQRHPFASMSFEQITHLIQQSIDELSIPLRAELEQVKGERDAAVIIKKEALAHFQPVLDIADHNAGLNEKLREESELLRSDLTAARARIGELETALRMIAEVTPFMATQRFSEVCGPIAAKMRDIAINATSTPKDEN